jgi:SHS2 domain-containing protein
MHPYYREHEHAADIFVEVRGRDLAELYEHGLYALYANLAELGGVRAAAQVSLTAQGADPAETLRALLGEALYQFENTGFLAGSAKVEEAQPQSVRALLEGETLDRTRHVLLGEIKAVTYHQLWAGQGADGVWAAKFILDV